MRSMPQNFRSVDDGWCNFCKHQNEVDLFFELQKKTFTRIRIVFYKIFALIFHFSYAIDADVSRSFQFNSRQRIN